MTIWDKIYNDFNDGGDPWATLSEDIDPRFVRLLDSADFRKKSAFDIGCGTGKYLKYLQDRGFVVSGIDSSETAVKMSGENLGADADIILADMYNFELPKNRFDLIISISTIHHGTKSQIQSLISRIYSALAGGGYIFITLPDMECNKKWNTFKNDKELVPGTYAPLSGPEKGLPHSFYSKIEIEKLFSDFVDITLEIDNIGRWFVVSRK